MCTKQSRKPLKLSNQVLPEQSVPWFPWLQVHNPVVWLHCPFPLHGEFPPGHDLSGKKKAMSYISNSN